MQFFIYFTRTEDEPMTPPNPEGMAEMGKLMQEAINSGMVVATGQLPTEVTHVKLHEGEISVSDGPFMESKEVVPGYTIIQVDSKKEAVDWATRLRKCMGEGTLRMAQVHVPSME